MPAASLIEASAVTVTSLDGRPVALQADGDTIRAQERWDLAVVPEAARLIGAW